MKTGPKPRTEDQIPDCTALGCSRKAVYRTPNVLCNSHYRRTRMGVSVDTPLRIAAYTTTCSEGGCGRPPVGGGLCSAHYQQKRRGQLVGSLREIKVANTIIEDGAVSYVVLTGNSGQEVARATVDTEDVPALAPHRWRSHHSGYKGAKAYARAHSVGTMAAYLLRPGAGFEVDHVNRDTLDNRRCNLRVVTHAVNAQNKGPQHRLAETRHLPVGVGLVKSTGRYQAYATLRGKMHHGGYYSTIEEADAAASALRLRLFGPCPS